MEPKEKVIEAANIWEGKEPAEFLKNFQNEKEVQFPVDPRMTDRQKLDFIVTVIIIFLLIVIFVAFASAAWNYFQNKQLSEVL